LRQIEASGIYVNTSDHTDAAMKAVPMTTIPALLAETDKRMIVDTLKQLDGLKKQLHRLLGT
jgi:hypothetical protein